MRITPSRQARIAAGLSLEQVARRMRITVPYLRGLEARNSFSFILAERLAALYSVQIDLFLPTARLTPQTRGARGVGNPVARAAEAGPSRGRGEETNGG